MPNRIKWHSVVLSFTFTSKETKGGKDPLIPIRSRLEDLDIKTIIPFIPDKTTHVVAGKRNTAKCLQALVNAKFIVASNFLNALEYATSPENLDEPESFSPLEANFDQFWPKEQEYLPAPSKEPGQHSVEIFSPDRARKDVFDGYTFVFFDQTQFDSLQPPISEGKGIALYYPVEKGITIATEIVRYLKEAAREEGIGEFEDRSQGRGPVHIQFIGGKGFEEWATDVQREASSIVGQQVIGQNEFLEAILINDASTLRRRIPVEEEASVPTGPSRTRSPTQEPDAMDNTQAIGAATSAQRERENPESPPSPPKETAKPSKSRVRPRGTIVSAFKGFDDGFEPTQVPPPERAAQIESQSINGTNGVSQILEDDSPRMAIDSEEEDQPATNIRASRKRPLPSEDEDDDNESLLPAAAAMKRRRIEEEKEARRRGISPEPASRPSKQVETAPPPKPKKMKKEVDIQEAVRERRQAEDEAAHRDEESLRQTLNDMSVEEMQNLAVVEEMEVAEKEPLARQTNGQSDRWDERWNGRQNFKKFRRQGQGPAPRRAQRVIVPLEEVRKTGQSIVPPADLESMKSRRRRRVQQQPTPEEISPAQIFTSAQSNQEDVPAEVASGDEPAVIDVDAPRTTRLRDRTNQSQLDAHGFGRRGTKRPSPVGGTEMAPPKKQKLFVATRDESDSEEEMKFRFRKRK